MKKTVLVLLLLVGLSVNVYAKEKFATLGDDLPKKGEPTALQMKNGGSIQVTNDNFILAESDKYMFEQQAKGKMNVFNHDDILVTPDTQTVVRQNRDTMYSKGIFDSKGGITFELPVIDTYQSMQIIDEQHRTVAVLYAEKGKNKITVTPDMLSSGEHLWVVMRTQIKSMAKKDVADGSKKQHMVKVTASSSNPYIPKGFDQKSREAIRIASEKEILNIDFIKSFGPPGSERVKKFDARVATAMGYGGLTSEDAYYKIFLSEDRSGTCQTITFAKPPLKEKGFFSITTYGPDAYIHAYNYAISNREAVPNEDGSYTVNFNCEGKKNNLDVLPGWTAAMRLYLPKTLDTIVEYAKTVPMPHTPKK